MLKPYYSEAGITIYHGDCREVLPLLGLVDHVITDPPYDEHTHSKQRRGAANGRGHQFGFNGGGSSGISMERHLGFRFITAEDMARVAREVARLSRRWVLIFCAMEQQAEWKLILAECGLEHVRFGVWHKPGATPQFTGDRPGTVCEAIEIAHPAGRKRWNGGGGFGFWVAPIVKAHTGLRCHPTQKPEELIAALVTDFTDAGETILDPFMGSGTTLVAAKRLGRKAIGIELEEKYCEIAVKRLAQGALPLYGAESA
jgi:DNA modification methylase